MDWSGVDYCDVFISCLDSHSDGTHSLQRIHWWASDVMLNFSKSDLGWPEGDKSSVKFELFLYVNVKCQSFCIISRNIWMALGSYIRFTCVRLLQWSFCQWCKCWEFIRTDSQYIPPPHLLGNVTEKKNSSNVSLNVKTYSKHIQTSPNIHKPAQSCLCLLQLDGLCLWMKGALDLAGCLFMNNSSCCFLWFTGTFHRRNGFYTVQAVCAIALHLPYT